MQGERSIAPLSRRRESTPQFPSEVELGSGAGVHSEAVHCQPVDESVRRGNALHSVAMTLRQSRRSWSLAPYRGESPNAWNHLGWLHPDMMTW